MRLNAPIFDRGASLDQHVQELISAMADIQNQFRGVYNIAEDDPSFAMDIEFKVTRDDELHIKQARPWID